MNKIIYLSIILLGLAIIAGFIKVKQLEKIIRSQREIIDEYKKVVQGNKETNGG